jgi:hypothetical protein
MVTEKRMRRSSSAEGLLDLIIEAETRPLNHSSAHHHRNNSYSSLKFIGEEEDLELRDIKSKPRHQAKRGSVTTSLHTIINTDLGDEFDGSAIQRG